MAVALNTSSVKNDLNLDNNWDPTKPIKGKEVVSSRTSQRVMIDIMECVNPDNHGIFVVQDSENALIAHAVIVGPENTPYEGGFFYFLVKFPADYPLSPLRVKLMNTERNSIRFNPNFYRNGMVCLSILGTNTGPGWSPLNTLFGVLLSIQSLMNKDPFHNAPGLRGFKQSDDNTPKKYLNYIRHETIRVAVISFMNEDNLDTKQMPVAMRETINRIFVQEIPFYFRTITDNLLLDDTEMFDPFNYCVTGQRFDYNSLKTMMRELAKKHQTDPEILRDTFNSFDIDIGGIDSLVEQSESECSDLSDSE